MRTLLIPLLAVCALACGCHAHTSQALLERDSRLMEDRIYELEGMLEDCCESRESALRQNEELKRDRASSDPASVYGGSRSRGTGSPPEIELPSSSEPPRRSRRSEAPPLEAPTIELPEPTDSAPVEMAPGDEEAVVVDGEAAQIVINKRLTGGLDRDGNDGDEGVLVMIEPRDEGGRLVKTPGSVSVVVMDPAEEGDAARVARWDFEAGEVSNHFHNTIYGRGLQFELPWPSEPPKNRDLRLFIRYTTKEGRKLTAETGIVIRSAGDAPKLDRQTKSRSDSESANRDRRAPEKSRKSDKSRAEGDDKADPYEESPRQASRQDRPVWKPYR